MPIRVMQSGLRFVGLSDREVEDLIALIWCTLEEHQIGSPSVIIERQPDGLTDVCLAFRAKDAERFRSAWKKELQHAS